MFLVVVLAMALTSLAAPYQAVNESSPAALPKCKTYTKRSLLRLLGAERQVLQQYTPDMLCLQRNRECSHSRFTPSNQSSRGARRGSTEKLRRAYRTNHLQLLCDASLLKGLMVRLPPAESPCSWRMTCNRYSKRFPETLCQAELATDGLNCLGYCREIQQDVWVLRKKPKSHCWAWAFYKMALTVGYKCETTGMNV